MKHHSLLLLLLVCLLASHSLRANSAFDPAFTSDSTYWGDGKAEVSYFSMQEKRYGTLQPGEMTIILVRESFAPDALVKADDWQREGTYPVLKLNLIQSIRAGTYDYLQMFSAFWRTHNAELIKWSLTSNDGCGNTFKIAERDRDQWRARYFTYWEGMVEGESRVENDAILYDTLPYLVRAISSTDQETKFPIRLVPTVIVSKKGSFNAVDAEVIAEAAVSGADTRVVRVLHPGGEDRFLVDTKFPRLLRRWEKADGSVAELKSAIKLPYWEWNQPGDREKALADPALRID